MALGFALNAALSVAWSRGAADVALTLAFAASLALSSKAWREALALPLIGSAVGLAFEAVGVRYGVPFGRYSYSDFGPEVLGVPVPIVLAWGIYLFLCYSSAASLASGWRRVALASGMMVAIDLAADPVMVELGAWSWEVGSGITWFGVPPLNFLGWLVVSALSSWTHALLFSGSPKGASRAWTLSYMSAFLPLLAASTAETLLPCLLGAAAGAFLIYAASAWGSGEEDFGGLSSALPPHPSAPRRVFIAPPTEPSG